MFKKKILFIMHYPPPIHGAAMVGQYIRESELLNSEFTTKYINLSTSKSVDEIGQTGIVKWVRYLKIILKTIKELWFFRPNLVYITLTAQGIGFYKDALLVFLAKLHGIKVIIHFHNKGVQSRQDYTLDNLLYKWVFKNTKVILLAPELYQDVQKYVPLDHVYYCANGIPEIKRLVVEDKEEAVPPVLLFLSNLILSKGVLVLLDASKILKQQGIDFHCNVVGGAGDLSEKEFEAKINELGLETNVSYLGKKYGDDKIEIFNDASIFVLPTFYENECFPLVLLEAMQFSLPLVSTDEGGIPSIIDNGENGYLVPKKNAAALAETLKELIKNADLRIRMGKKANIDFNEKYTLSIFESNIVSILKQVLT